jgi:hypothetical protein
MQFINLSMQMFKIGVISDDVISCFEARIPSQLSPHDIFNLSGCIVVARHSAGYLL